MRNDQGTFFLDHIESVNALLPIFYSANLRGKMSVFGQNLDPLTKNCGIAASFFIHDTILGRIHLLCRI